MVASSFCSSPWRAVKSAMRPDKWRAGLSEGHFCLEDQGLVREITPAPGKRFIKSSSFPRGRKSAQSNLICPPFIPSTNICSVPATRGPEVWAHGQMSWGRDDALFPRMEALKYGRGKSPPEWKRHEGQNFACSVFLVPRRMPGMQQALNTYGLNKEGTYIPCRSN